MGLGKTLQTISFLAWLKFERGVPGPHLVVAPLSVLSSWMSEFRRFCPQLKVVKLHSADPAERERLKQSLKSHGKCADGGAGDFDVVVTTYEMAKSPAMASTLAHRTYWRYLVLDEVRGMDAVWFVVIVLFCELTQRLQNKTKMPLAISFCCRRCSHRVM